ncbi:MAG: Holliday junction branch migration protein RuvA [Acidimicrobiia bacterium]|nr:Holliday junction branch migration protein RuvA [Acidimicrobiia bacterium]
MIGRIRGVLVSNRPGSVVIDVDGLGYEVAMTPRDVGSLPGIGEEIVIHTHTHVREDEISLYGFASENDRELFRILLTASGVGPKLAMALLASLSGAEIIVAITGEDPDALTVTPGVGKRGAQKIVLELAPKLAGREAEVVGGGDLVDVRTALEGLGYTTPEINSVVGDLDPSDPIEAQIKSALQSLGNQRHA